MVTLTTKVLHNTNCTQQITSLCHNDKIQLALLVHFIIRKSMHVIIFSGGMHNIATSLTNDYFYQETDTQRIELCIDISLYTFCQSFSQKHPADLFCRIGSKHSSQTKPLFSLLFRLLRKVGHIFGSKKHTLKVEKKENSGQEVRISW